MKGLIVYVFVLFFVTACDCKEICCGDEVGCFSNLAPFHNFPLPECSDKLGLKMKIYTRENPEGDEISRENLPETWDPSKQMVFVVHGYRENGGKSWMIKTKDKLLMKDDLNVVLVGWEDGANNIWYPQAASNVRTVGAELAAFVNMLNEFDQDYKPYCIGFSLGAHVCAHMGMRTKLARITGLDPAGPWFEKEEDSVGLNPNCADYVDVIHTHGRAKITGFLNLGTLKEMGHVDFYPNGGAWQPGCLLDAYSLGSACLNYDTGYFTACNNVSSTKRLTKRDVSSSLQISCSHGRSHDLFIDSFFSEGGSCSYVTMKKCTDSRKLPRSCDPFSGEPQKLGYSSIKYDGRGIYYLKTSYRAPYCAI